MNGRAVWVLMVAIGMLGCGGMAEPGADASVAVDAGLPDVGPPDAPLPRDPRFDALAAAIEADLEDNLATGASVAVWLDEEIVYVGGFGVADPEARTPDEDTLFMIGSDTKKITSILFLQDVAAGRATIETTVGDVIPELEMENAPDFVGATAHDLLSHQGGVVDWLGPLDTSTTDEALRSRALGAFSDRAYALAPPGHFYNYSNPNFSIAGLMSETLAVAPWADLARERVFVPLGMTRTVARKSEVDANHAAGIGIARASDTETHPVSLEDTWEGAFVRPAGLVWSTPSDQMRLARFLVDGDEDVLSSALVESLHQRHAPRYPDLPGHYGYGLFVEDGITVGDRYYEVEAWTHGGNTQTHTSTFYVLPEQRFAISILSNGLGDDFSASIAAAISSLVTLPEPTTPPARPFDPSQLDGLLGTYADPFNVGDVTVTREGDVLQLHMPALEAAGVPYERAMSRISTRVWIAGIQGTTLPLLFIDGPEGETYLANRAFVATRAAVPAPPARPAIAVRRPMPSRETILRALQRAPLTEGPPLLRQQ